MSKFLRTFLLDNSAPSGSTCGFSGSGAGRQVKWHPKLSKCIQVALFIVVLGGAPRHLLAASNDNNVEWDGLFSDQGPFYMNPTGTKQYDAYRADATRVQRGHHNRQH